MLETIVRLVESTIEEISGSEVFALNTSANKSSMFDYVIIATGTSARHLQSMANLVKERLEGVKHKVFNIEGDVDSEWVLIDADNIIVHLFTQRERELYDLESLFKSRTKLINQTKSS